MSVAVRADRKGDHASVAPIGPFDLAHATAVRREVEIAEALLNGCRSVDIDLAQLDRIDGAGAVLLARLLDRLDADGCRASIVEGHNVEAARLIALYRERRADPPSASDTRDESADADRRAGGSAAWQGKRSIRFYWSLCCCGAESGRPDQARSIGVRCRG